VISEFAPLAAAPKFVLASLAVVAPVPPYNTPIDVVAETTPLFACSGPFNVPRVNVELNVFVPLHTLFVVVPNAREIAFVFLCIGYVNVSGLSYVPKSETCDFVIERFGRAVIPEIDDEADNLLSKSVLDQYLFVLPCANASVVVAEKNV